MDMKSSITVVSFMESSKKERKKKGGAYLEMLCISTNPRNLTKRKIDVLAIK
jgi:hypothetical protein